MNYEEALSFIHSVEWQGSRPGLSRITELLSYLGNPQNSFKAIHVAGTNGKGSFCAMLESVLRAEGYTTGLFTSPYIEIFEERIRFCGKVIEKNELAEITSYVAGFCEKMSDKPTEFELITAIGFEYFRRKKVDIAVIECGMGGRLDSTNVLPSPLLSVITGIALDHVAFLGDTIEKIAFEKAGIIKNGCPVLFGGNSKPASKIISKIATERGSEYLEKDETLISDTEYSLSGTFFSYKEYKNIMIPLLGEYQPKNAATVLDAVDILGKQGIKISNDSVIKGLEKVSWKARFELLQKEPPVIFDGGHNAEGVSAAVKAVKIYFGDKRLSVISGVMKDKDFSVISDKIASIADTVFTVTPDNPRAMPAREYSKLFSDKGISSFPCKNFEDAVSSAFELAKLKNIPLICVGSLYSYSSFKNALFSLNQKNGKR